MTTTEKPWGLSINVGQHEKVFVYDIEDKSLWCNARVIGQIMANFASKMRRLETYNYIPYDDAVKLAPDETAKFLRTARVRLDRYIQSILRQPETPGSDDDPKHINYVQQVTTAATNYTRALQAFEAVPWNDRVNHGRDKVFDDLCQAEKTLKQRVAVYERYLERIQPMALDQGDRSAGSAPSTALLGGNGDGHK